MKYGTVILSDTKNPSTVFGIHGGTGTLLWKRLATGSHLQADWDGFEWVALGPGDRVGKHTLTHTEEIFYFLSGTGQRRDLSRRSTIGAVTRLAVHPQVLTAHLGIVPAA